MEHSTETPMLNGSGRRSTTMADAQGHSMDDTMIELGLAKTCGHMEMVQESNGQVFREFCGKPVAEFGGFCAPHGGNALIKQRREIAKEKVVLAQKRHLEEEVLPKATKRVMAILENPDSKDADVIKVWQTTMDRIGLGAVTGILLDGDIKIDAPLDILRRMLTANMGTAEEIVEGEVVED